MCNVVCVQAKVKGPMNYICVISTFLSHAFPGCTVGQKSTALKHLRIAEWISDLDKEELKPLVILIDLRLLLGLLISSTI